MDTTLETKKLRLYLISGFLGAGKTTLVKRLLTQSDDMKIGVVMNEFGKVSIDGPILKSDRMEMIELTRGSIFCSCLTMAFAEALVEMASRDLDCVVVESSGLADPSNIGEILSGVQLLAERSYTYSGSITVVDASQFLKSYETIETIVKQIECADLTLVNKSDLVSQETLAEIEKKILEINPTTEVRSSSFFSELPEVLRMDLAKGRYPELRASLNTPENKPKTMSLSFDEAVSRSELEAFIRSVMNDAYRVKGFFELESKWWEVHGVGDCIDFYETDRHLETSTLVIISKVGPNIIRIVDQTWKALVNKPMKLGNG